MVNASAPTPSALMLQHQLLSVIADAAVDWLCLCVSAACAASAVSAGAQRIQFLATYRAAGLPLTLHAIFGERTAASH